MDSPPPPEVYRHQQFANSNFSYVIPTLTPGQDYGVTLHFAEMYYDGPGNTLFDVKINGVAAMTQLRRLRPGGREV